MTQLDLRNLCQLTAQRKISLDLVAAVVEFQERAEEVWRQLCQVGKCLACHEVDTTQFFRRRSMKYLVNQNMIRDGETALVQLPERLYQRQEKLGFLHRT